MPAAQYRILYLAEHDRSAGLVQVELDKAGYTIDVAYCANDLVSLPTAGVYEAVLLEPHWLIKEPSERVQKLLRQLAAPVIIVAAEPLPPSLVAACRQVPVAAYFVRPLQADDLPLLSHLVEQTIVHQQTVREQERAFHALQQDNRNLKLLTRLAQLLTSTLEVKQVISQLVQAINEIVVTEGSSVWLWDSDEPGALVCAAMYLNHVDITASQMRLPPKAGVVGWVAHHGDLVNVRDAVTDPRFSALLDQQTGFTTRSILAVPLITRNEVIGVLEFVNKLNGEFDDQDCELAETVAAYAANAIENARLMASISRQRDQLERQNEALDAFAHSVAHDLKNPLTLIVGFADFLRDGFASLPTESVAESLDTIVEYSVKMSHIVDALLLLANVGAGDEVASERVDMGAIISAVLRRMEHSVREYGAEVSGPLEWPVALGNSSWLEGVWYNYLSNGLKYGGGPPPPGGSPKRGPRGARAPHSFWWRGPISPP